MVLTWQYPHYQMKLHLEYHKEIFQSLPGECFLPAAIRIYGSLISVFSEAPSIGSPDTAGCNTVNCNTND